MTLHRLKLRPRSAWRTPWQADTLLGMLLATSARVDGPAVLRERLIEPMLARVPPFVLSDACPGDLLPAPISLCLQDCPPEEWKVVRKVRWATRLAFDRLRGGDPSYSSEGLYAEDALVSQHARHHNTLSRLTDTTGEAASGLGPFNRLDSYLHTSGAAVPNSPLPPLDYLSVYFRAVDSEAATLLVDLFHELALVGFGADVATGRGHFALDGDPEPIPQLDTAPANFGGPNAAAGVVSLSTFQPGTGDPTDGLWQAFPKFGRLGPDLQLVNELIFKNTLIMFRPGALFHTPSPLPFVGRAIPMDEVLPPAAAAELRRRGVNVIHPAFGLCVPAISRWQATE